MEYWNACVSGLKDFVGLTEESEESKRRWAARRHHHYRTNVDSKQGKGLDEVDAPGTRSCRRLPMKKKVKSVPSIVASATGKAVGLGRQKPEYKLGTLGRSYAPAALDKKEKPDFNRYKDDLFYDEPLPVDVEKRSDMDQAFGSRPTRHLAAEPEKLGFREIVPVEAAITMSHAPNVEPSSAAPEELELRLFDKPETGMSRIPSDIAEGELILERLDDRLMDVIKCKCDNCCGNIEDDDFSNRPFFTVFITTVQTIIMICALAIYGIGPFGYDLVTETDIVLKRNLALEYEQKSESGNIWLGPSQQNLIHLGAKYSPCMRKDPNIEKALELELAEERTTGCCVRDDGSGCYQSVPGKCSKLISTFVKWNETSKIPGGYKSGAVCGEDPNYCKKPASTAPFEWDKNDFTKWPVCEDTNIPGHIGGGCSQNNSDCHMKCQLLGRPCCFGIQGECMITTREQCDFHQGYYHDDKFLCSQVNCLEQICGMIPFVYPDRPDQFSRILSANLLHAGVFHLLITIIIQLWIMREVEILVGSIRMTIIYLGSGIGGALASALLIPYQVEVGPSGAIFGVLACMDVDIFNRIIENRANGESHLNGRLWCFFGIYSGILVLLFILGLLLPWIDNWAHIFGFLFGFSLSLMVMKDAKIEGYVSRTVVFVVSLVIVLLLYILLIIGFYAAPVTESSWLRYINCIPFTDTFCMNMDVIINRAPSYSTYV